MKLHSENTNNQTRIYPCSVHIKIRHKYKRAGWTETSVGGLLQRIGGVKEDARE